MSNKEKLIKRLEHIEDHVSRYTYDDIFVSTQDISGQLLDLCDIVRELINEQT